MWQIAQRWPTQTETQKPRVCHCLPHMTWTPHRVTVQHDSCNTASEPLVDLRWWKSTCTYWSSAVVYTSFRSDFGSHCLNVCMWGLLLNEWCWSSERMSNEDKMCVFLSVSEIRACVMSSSHAQDLSEQAAHDSAQTESAALNVSINASTHLVCKSNLQNLKIKFPNRLLSLWL